MESFTQVFGQTADGKLSPPDDSRIRNVYILEFEKLAYEYVHLLYKKLILSTENSGQSTFNHCFGA